MCERLISSAPRDGTYIKVCAYDDGVVTGPYVMCWDKDYTNPLVGPHKGMWVSDFSVSRFTWDESRGFGPSHWEPIH